MAQTRQTSNAENKPARSLFDQSDTIDVMSLLGALRRRKWMIIAITLTGLAVGSFYGNSVIPKFTSRAAVLIEPEENQVVDMEAVMNGLTPDQATIATQITLLQSRTYQARIMEDLDLFNDPEFNPLLREPGGPLDRVPLEVVSQPLEQLLAWLPNEWLIATGLAGEAEPVLESEAPHLAREETISNFSKRLQLYNDGESHVITISFTSIEPDKASLIANRIAETYVNDQLNNKLFATDRASVWLQERIRELKEEVRLAEEAVSNFKTNNTLIASQGGATLNQQELSDINKELIVARGQLAEKQAKLRLVSDLQASGQSLESVTEVVNSPLIVRLRENETDILRQEAELRTLYGERHPRMQQLQSDKANLQDKIASEVDRIIRTLENDVRVASTRIRTIESQLGDVKSQTAVDQAASVRLAELERQAAASRALYESFLQRFKETREQLEIVQPDVRIIATANPPSKPSTPGAKLFAAAGLTLSLAFSSLLAIILEKLDRGIRSAREIQRQLGLNTLGLVPKLDKLKKNQKPYQYLMDKPLSAYAEAIRSIYMALKLGGAERQTKVVLVTSSLPQDGKTTLAVSLATFAARSHKKVLLLDLDLRHPSVHRELGWQVSGGLVEYMANERSLDDIVHHDLETGLHFLPIKGQTTNPTDLLDSQKMRALVDTLRDRYDYVIMDSAPLASVTDTRLAALLADKVIFVVRWGETMPSAAEDSIKTLRDIDIEPAGAVITQIDMKKHAQYGYSDVGEYYSKSQKYYVN